MFQSKTVFVLGAGASHEVGLPLGASLRRIIADKVNFDFDMIERRLRTGDKDIYEVLRRPNSPDFAELFNACKAIHNGVMLSSSIDDFIDIHQHDRKIEQCAKLAILHSILQAERTSKLFVQQRNIDDTIDFSTLDKTWYVPFYQLLIQGVRKEKLSTLFKNVTVIDFNYDRCFLHFLSHAIAASYQIPFASAVNLTGSLPYFRPYGSVGDHFGLPPMLVEFGCNGRLNFDMVKGLKTYTEQIDDNDSLKAMRNSIANAEIVVFLGFAFHDNNMRLLTTKPDSQTKGGKRLFFTRAGISDADVEITKNKMREMCGARRKLKNVFDGYEFLSADTCHTLFNDYRMSIRR